MILRGGEVLLLFVECGTRRDGMSDCAMTRLSSELPTVLFGNIFRCYGTRAIGVAISTAFAEWSERTLHLILSSLRVGLRSVSMKIAADNFWASHDASALARGK